MNQRPVKGGHERGAPGAPKGVPNPTFSGGQPAPDGPCCSRRDQPSGRPLEQPEHNLLQPAPQSRLRKVELRGSGDVLAALQAKPAPLRVRVELNRLSIEGSGEFERDHRTVL